MEVLVAVCDLMGIETGVDVFGIQDVAEDLVVLGLLVVAVMLAVAALTAAARAIVTSQPP